MVLTEEHTRLPIVGNPALFRLLGRTGKFIPTPPANQLLWSLPLSLNVFAHRVFCNFTRYVHKDLAARDEAEDADSNMLPWRPKAFPHGSSWYKTRRNQIFSSDNSTWREFKGLCPELPAALRRFEYISTERAKAIVDHLPKSKWNNLSKAEIDVMNQLREPKCELRVGSADKNLGPTLCSEFLYVKQLLLNLTDGKGTYVEIKGMDVHEILNLVNTEFRRIAAPFVKDPCFRRLIRIFENWHQAALKEPHLCPIYLLWKLHKAADPISGLWTRAIIPNVGYFTCQISIWLHSQLNPWVMAHPYVLKDSLSLCRTLDKIRLPENIKIATFDVTALYPSIDLERGLRSLGWFIRKFTIFDEPLTQFILALAEFVLTNCFIECRELNGRIFHQLIGTAMGTTFSVVYSVIHMIHVESAVVDQYAHSITLYKRFIDDGICLWHGVANDFLIFAAALNQVDPSIRLTWSSLGNQAIFMDLEITISKSVPAFEVYSKPRNSYAYLTRDTFHPRHIFPAWIKAELLRILTHCSTQKKWAEHCRSFYEHLRERGYGARFILTEFRKIAWADRKQALQPRRSSGPHNSLSHSPDALVWSCTNSQGLECLFKMTDLDLSQVNHQIFPDRVKTVVKSATRMSILLQKKTIQSR